MKSKLISIWKFILTFIVPLFNFLILTLTLLIAINKILLWEYVNLFVSVHFQRVLGLFLKPPTTIPTAVSDFTIGAAWFIVIASLLLLLLTNKYIRNINLWQAGIPFFGILILAGTSAFWSVANTTTMSRFLTLAATAAGGVYLGLQFKKSILIRLFEVFAILVILVSLLLVYKYPLLGIQQANWAGVYNVGAWRGIFTWKGYLAELITFAIILFLLRLANFKNEGWFTRIYSFAFYALAVFVLVKTKSATEQIAVIAVHIVLGLAILYLKWGHKLKPVHWWMLGAVGLAGLLAIWFGRGPLLGLIGRSSDLTGRLPLWNAILPSIKERLYFGYGFGEAFWNNKDFYSKVWAIMTWNPPHAHNGYVEALLDTGIVGLVLWVIFIIQTAYLSIGYFLRERTLPALIFFAWCVSVIISNIGDNKLGTLEAFGWFLLVTAFSFLIRNILDHEQRISGVSPKV